MKKIAVFGAGGFGQEVACVWMDRLKADKEDFEFIGFFDDGKVGEKNIYGNVIGNINDLNQYTDPLEVGFALGNAITLNKVVEKVNNPNLSFPNIIHPTLRYLDTSSFQIGYGNIISLDVIFSNKIKVGNFNIFNTRVTLGHDVQVGSFNIFSPNVQISGEVHIGNRNYLGFNSGIIQCKKIGDENVLGAGAILLRSIENNGTYVGVPATKLSF